MSADLIQLHQPVFLFLSIVLFVFALRINGKACKRDNINPWLNFPWKNQTPRLTQKEKILFSFSVGGSFGSLSLTLSPVITAKEIEISAIIVLLAFIVSYLFFFQSASNK